MGDGWGRMMNRNPLPRVGGAGAWLREDVRWGGWVGWRGYGHEAGARARSALDQPGPNKSRKDGSPTLVTEPRVRDPP